MKLTFTNSELNERTYTFGSKAELENFQPPWFSVYVIIATDRKHGGYQGVFIHGVSYGDSLRVLNNTDAKDQVVDWYDEGFNVNVFEFNDCEEMFSFLADYSETERLKELM